MIVIKKKSFTRFLAMLLAVLTVISLFPVSALAAPDESSGEQTSIPTIVFDENGNLVTGRRKAPGFRIALTFL